MRICTREKLYHSGTEEVIDTGKGLHQDMDGPTFRTDSPIWVEGETRFLRFCEIYATTQRQL